MSKLYFIAEIGQNHQGSLNIAKEMIDSLIGTGVKAIKTAKRDIEIFADKWKNYKYDSPNSFGWTYYDHRKALELSKDDFLQLKLFAEDRGFEFISSFTDIPSFNFLNEIGLKKIKIASQRIVDIKLLKHAAKYFKGTVFMSSGMSSLRHIDEMIKIFKKNKKYIMQCTSVYPCSDKMLNLRVLKSYRKRYKKKVNGFGFSGHHLSIAPDIAAYALGATVIERHYTLDRTWKGSDHAGALEKAALKSLIKDLNLVAQSLGDSEKKILPEEIPTIKRLRSDL